MFRMTAARPSFSSSTSSELSNDVFYDSCHDDENCNGAHEYVAPVSGNEVAVWSTRTDNGWHDNDGVVLGAGSRFRWRRCSVSSDDDERFTHVNIWCDMRGANECSRTETFYLPNFCRSEEPVASNMDISTGHIVLVSKFQSRNKLIPCNRIFLYYGKCTCLFVCEYFFYTHYSQKVYLFLGLDTYMHVHSV